MKRFFYFAAAILSVASCSQKNITPEVNPGEELYRQTEFVEFYADVREKEEGATKVDFEYSDKLYNRWEGNEEMDVYIKHNGTYGYAGRIPAVEGSLSSDKFSLSFAGDVKKRENPETDTFVMVYTNSGAAYDWTKQTLDMREEAAGTNGLKALKNFSPIVWDFDADTGTYSNMSNKACYIKFTASGLGKNVKVKSLAIYSPTAVFPKTFDLSKFEYQAGNKSKTLSYAFENLSTDENGNLNVFLAAPVVGNGQKSYDVYLVLDNEGVIETKKSGTGITSDSAMSESKVYKLTRNNFSSQINPSTIVGDASDNVESIVGQWDKTGYLSNDIYGVLDMGKPECLTPSHNSAINAIDKIYITLTNWDRDTDKTIHKAAVIAAGMSGQSENSGVTMSDNGPQFITEDMYNGTNDQTDELTFNNVVITKDTEVYMTFINSKAWNTNTIGYYHYPTASENTYKQLEAHDGLHKYIVFPSTSQNATDPGLVHKFEARTTAQLLYSGNAGSFTKKFPAGTTIGFMERVNALEQGSDFSLKPISADSPVHYTNIAWNRKNVFGFNNCYWNQIAVLKFKMPDDTDFNRHGIILAMKDKYAIHGSSSSAANWTNPIILIYTSEADAIDFTAGNRSSYWNSTVDLSGQSFSIGYNLESVTSTNAATAFSGDSYTTTLTVANAEFGNFSQLKVKSGDLDITDKVVSNIVEATSSTPASATVTISKNDVCGDIIITAHAARQIYAQSLTAEQLTDLAKQTAPEDLPRFRLILHSTTAAHGNVAFGLNPYGNSFILPQAQSPLYNANSQHTFTTPTAVRVSDQYNDYEWSIEKAEDSSGNFIGFRLKKVTKYADDDVRTDGFITRGSDYFGQYPYVRLSKEGTVLTAEPVGSGYQMRIKSADVSYQYMTCAIGQSLQSAIFNSAGAAHTNQYGTWLVYMVTLSNN